jgi:hypothetical protein
LDWPNSDMPIAVDIIADTYFHCTSPSWVQRAGSEQSELVIPPTTGGHGRLFAITDRPPPAPTVVEDSHHPSPVEPTPIDVAVRQLVGMATWEANWDGNGAERPIVASLKDARAFLRSLAVGSATPKPALDADGHAILFLRGDNIYAELEFLEGRKIDFYARRGGQEWSDEFSFDGRTLPEGLLRVGLAV